MLTFLPPIQWTRNSNAANVNVNSSVETHNEK
jgi:hypothetical protein